MAQLLIENVGWLVAGVVALLVGVKIIAVQLFKRLSDDGSD